MLVAQVGCLSSMREYKGHRVFNPLYLFYLESSARDQWQMPKEVVEALELSSGQTIADIGAGGGYFTEKFSKQVGEEGRVFATDVQSVMIRKLKARVEKQGLSNVTVIAGDFDHPRLPAASCDIVFFSSVYKEISDRVPYMERVAKALKEGGRVAIIEYRIDDQSPGPPVKYRLSAEQVIAELEQAGFRWVKQYDFLPREYFLVFGLTTPIE